MATYYLNIKNADIPFPYKNFRGIEKDMNAAGSRNVAVIIHPEDEFQITVYGDGERKSFIGNYQTLIDQGWNIREQTRKEKDGTKAPTGNYILSSVKISFYPEKYAPVIKYYPNPDSKSFVILNEELLDPAGEYGKQLDNDNFEQCNINIRGYNDKPGHVSAFVSDMLIVGKPSIFDEWGYGEEY